MDTWSRFFAASGAVLLALATGLAAWHAHGLSTQLEEHAYGAFARALQQQSWAGLGLLALSLWRVHAANRWNLLAGCALVIGAVLFCGDVYLGALRGQGLGVAPLGGSTLILAWLLAAVAVCQRP